MVDVKVAYSQELGRVSRRSLHQESDDRFRMVALDLDGTLLQSSTRQMSKATVAYLQSLSRRGLTISFCTGRGVRSTYPHIQSLNLNAPLPVVCTNGAKGILVHHDTSSTEHKQPQSRSLFEYPLTHDVTRRAHQFAQSLGYVSLWYYDDAIYANATTDDHSRLVQLFERLIKSQITCKNNEDEFQRGCEARGPPSRIVVLFWDPNSRKVARAFEQELQGDATLVPGSKGLYLEILSGGVHKGHGLHNLCEELQIPLSKCIAIGDGDNDVEFLQMAGFGICMKNGQSQTKQVADAVTQWTNNEDGVIKALQQLEALGVLQLYDDDE